MGYSDTLRVVPLVTLLAPLAAGCGLVLDLDPRSVDGGPDLIGIDTGIERDGASAVDAAPPWACTHPSLSEGDVATYHFEEDLAGTRSGPLGVASPEAEASYVGGPDGCGQALGFRGDYFVQIPHVPAWDTVASVDFWVLSPTAHSSGFVGLVGRDATLQRRPGHISVVRSQNDRILVRVQPGDPGGILDEARCTPLLDLRAWTHVGINVGEPELELWIDGARVDDRAPDSERWIECGAGLEPSPTLEGNENPWVLGAVTSNSAEGFAGPVRGYAPDGAIDELRFSTSRRDFSVMRR